MIKIREKNCFTVIWLVRFQLMTVIWLVNRLYRQTEGKECGSTESSRLWRGPLRDEPKSGFEGDYTIQWSQQGGSVPSNSVCYKGPQSILAKRLSSNILISIKLLIWFPRRLLLCLQRKSWCYTNMQCYITLELALNYKGHTYEAERHFYKSY